MHAPRSSSVVEHPTQFGLGNAGFGVDIVGNLGGLGAART